MKFDLQGTTAQRQVLSDALAHCTYPFELAALNETIPIKFADCLTKYNALGLFWLDGRIDIEQTLTDPLEIAEVLLSEVAHAVDQYTLTEADHIVLQSAWHPSGPDEHTWFDKGPYQTWEGEAMMALFVTAFSDVPVTMTLVHKPTPETIALLRSMAPQVVVPVPDPEPEVTYVGCRRSSVFHVKGAHWYACHWAEWPTRATAEASGRTAHSCVPTAQAVHSHSHG